MGFGFYARSTHWTSILLPKSFFLSQSLNFMPFTQFSSRKTHFSHFSSKMKKKKTGQLKLFWSFSNIWKNYIDIESIYFMHLSNSKNKTIIKTQKEFFCDSPNWFSELLKRLKTIYFSKQLSALTNWFLPNIEQFCKRKLLWNDARAEWLKRFLQVGATVCHLQSSSIDGLVVGRGALIITVSRCHDWTRGHVVICKN